MTDADLITDVRLIALETIVQKMLASQFSQCDPGKSCDLKEQMIASCSKPDVFRGEGPTLVDDMKTQLLASHVQHFFAVVEERETDIREGLGLPPLNPL